MIARLRARHRFMFTGLALGISPLLAAALLWRSGPVDQVFPVDASPKDTPSLTLSLEGELGLELDVLQQGTVIRLLLPPRKADVLAYWSAQAAAGAGLPDEVLLLGPVSAQRDNFFPRAMWPQAAYDQVGFLILYSLGHQEVVSSISIPALGGAS